MLFDAGNGGGSGRTNGGLVSVCESPLNGIAFKKHEGEHGHKAAKGVLEKKEYKKYINISRRTTSLLKKKETKVRADAKNPSAFARGGEQSVGRVST